MQWEVCQTSSDNSALFGIRLHTGVQRTLARERWDMHRDKAPLVFALDWKQPYLQKSYTCEAARVCPKVSFGTRCVDGTTVA